MFLQLRRTRWPLAAAVALILAGGGIASAQTSTTDVVVYAADGRISGAAWQLVADATAAGGSRLWNPDQGVGKIGTPAATPASFVEFTVSVVAGQPYHLWIRAAAENNTYVNDSMFVQFSGAVDAAGAPLGRIGTASALTYSLEACSGAGDAGWGWEDTTYCGLSGNVYFSSTGTQTVRIQQREDGISFDQIMLSPSRFLSSAPGLQKSDTTIYPRSSTTSSPSPTPTITSPSDLVLYGADGQVSGSAWRLTSDATAAGGARMWNPDYGVAKIATAAANPPSYVELTFTPVAGQAYHLWVRGLADNNSYQNDSMFVQFSGAVDASGTAIDRIGTASALVYSLESCSGAGEAGWGWEDTTYCGSSPNMYFTSSSAQTIRIQQREDGLSFDQIVLSPSKFLSTAPGALKNDATIYARNSGSTTTSPIPAPAPSPTPTITSKLLRVLQWNTHHGGYGTDGIYSPDRLATWAASFQPDVISFNEIEKNDYWGNQDQPEVYKALLEQKTGKTWYYVFAQEFGQWTSNGKGNLILSTIPFDTTDLFEYPSNYDRSVSMTQITYNGRNITLMSTHLDPYDATLRYTQATQVTSWAVGKAENRILIGDLNAWPDQTSIAYFNQYYDDTWAVAAANGTAVSFAGNNGETMKGRIDYIYSSTGASSLVIRSSQVYDTRDANGYMPSDHRPVLTVFEVR
ncbi:MAG: hypothetical protein DMF86_07150 [Acidobacteria bacterium]|nr:MAG: hypothetical protein DMF86_07150 [Acidobacteriota bacterium]